MLKDKSFDINDRLIELKQKGLTIIEELHVDEEYKRHYLKKKYMPGVVLFAVIIVLMLFVIIENWAIVVCFEPVLIGLLAIGCINWWFERKKSIIVLCEDRIVILSGKRDYLEIEYARIRSLSAERENREKNVGYVLIYYNMFDDYCINCVSDVLHVENMIAKLMMKARASNYIKKK